MAYKEAGEAGYIEELGSDDGPAQPPRVGAVPPALVAAMQHEIGDSLTIAASMLISERLGGNVVKEEYWKGEIAALRRMQNVIARWAEERQ